METTLKSHQRPSKMPEVLFGVELGRKERLLLVAGFLARVLFFLYGIYQDAHFQVPYTDIDYYVFSDAARYVYYGGSPYSRDTYRYTPLLSWLLVPNFIVQWSHFGKMLFVLFDLTAGYLTMVLLKRKGRQSVLWLSGLWLLNPLAITISTRGNAESILCCLVLLAIYLLSLEYYGWFGVVFGLSVHFKIYPIIYSLPVAIYIWQRPQWVKNLAKVGVSSLLTLVALTALMYHLYGYEFLDQAYVYHLYRVDHRHNFSMWNMLLYFDSASADSNLSKYSFLPQLAIVAAVGLLQLHNKSTNHLLAVLFVQTFAFVAYNKVCTSQYFIWYLSFLPFYVQESSIKWQKALTMVGLWVLGQALWLSQAYQLEFNGLNVFFPRLFAAAIAFFAINVWILAQLISDIKTPASAVSQAKKTR